MKSPINSYFEHVFCLTLERRKDRYMEAKEEFERHGIDVEFIYGVDGVTLPQPTTICPDGTIPSKGDIGCQLSHLAIARLAKQRGYNNYFVFEDDAQMTSTFNTDFEKYIKQLPINWDFIYLGGNHDGGFKMVSDNMAKIARTYTTHAYGVRSTAIDAIIEVLSAGENKVDVGIASLHSKFNCYCIRPHLSWQKNGVSDILGKYVEYPHLKL